MVTKIPKYDNVKTPLFQEWRKVLDTEQNRDDSLKSVFLEEPANNSSFFRIDLTDDPGKRITVFAREYWEYLLRSRLFFSRQHI
jgi:hypothetical protein